ncbi:septation protein SepH [Pseudarthrobacter sp. J75]|uniref:septation protein SepH n=1 Tax=unclassified Pseudarthrobacter TaxID=2647000 RepID=UPI002E8233CE|nr:MULTISPECIES: septation protein SepH [unclassified Pseudarthrobacter]MEE2522707.1 septation protein SepH [Pseudarthrobacter sp. J47]MEE2529568.1 septation protein SepH [Pseudarthrobacter sp. J75]MEE2569664.1 septation protein SepH [Pseudarthrobacter sp. J64]
MQDLRLVGVHDDGTHLLLTGPGGEMFRLPIDEALRSASRQVAKPAGGAPVALSPRDIQARIRAGATASEVADLSGIPLAKVERYEGPVLAERDYVARQARKIEVAAPSPGHDAYRAAFGDQPATLEDMVSHRLRAHGLEDSAVEWDSWRRPDGFWTVVARFEVGTDRPTGIGEEPPAMWTFSPARKTLQNANRWAQQLSELEPLDGPVPARRLAAVTDRPFDFEAEAEASPAAEPAAPAAPVVPAQEADGLLDLLRARRGQRLGVDEDGDDALALLLSQGVPAAHPRPSEVPDGPGPAEGDDHNDAPEAPAAHGPATDADARRKDGRPSMMARLSLIPPLRDNGPDPAGAHDTEDPLALHDGVSTETREVTIKASPQTPAEPRPTTGSSGAGLDELLGGGQRRRNPDPVRPEQQGPAAGATPGSTPGSEPAAPERQPAKAKRSSVPTWDEIVFGTRGD